MLPNLSPLSLYSLNSELYASMMISGNQLDFRAKTEIAYYGKSLGSDMGLYAPLEFVVVASSGWSSTQTVTIPAYTDEAPNQNEPTPNPTYTPDQLPQTEITIAGFSLLEFSLVIILCTTLPVLIIALIYTRKTARHKQTAQT